MDNKQIVDQFSRFKLVLRPEALILIKQMSFNQVRMQGICEQLSKLDMDDRIVERYHIEQILQISQPGKQDLISTLRDVELNSIAIVDPYGPTHQYELECKVEDKIGMYTSRLAEVIRLLHLDNRYCFNTSLLQPNQILIMGIGSVVGRNWSENVTICGILVQLSNDEYNLSDGSISVRLKLVGAQHINQYDRSLPKGLINVGQVLVVQGKWEEQTNSFEVIRISLPFRDDIVGLLQNETFGVFQRIYDIFKSKINWKAYSIDQQKVIQFFPLQKQGISETWWFLSEFALDSIETQKRLSTLLNMIEKNKDDVVIPTAIFIFGKFYESRQHMRESEFASGILNTLGSLNCWVFWVPSFDDPICPSSLPHSAMPLHLLFGRGATLPPKFHSISNPSRVSLRGTKIQLIRNDVSREMRKSHVFGEAGFDYEEVCETIISQRYLTNTVSIESMVKWRYSKSLWVVKETSVLILADATLPQFVYQSKLSGTMVVNPGNFSHKGEFLIMEQRGGQVSFMESKC